MLRQIAAPIPRVPPVTNATRPESLSPVLLVRSWVAVTGSSCGSGACASFLGRSWCAGDAVGSGSGYGQHGAERAVRQDRARLPPATTRRAVAQAVARVPIGRAACRERG